jgi:[lysine-biosynthesis-protein LysW]---L-2-aminoadipate ligase
MTLPMAMLASRVRHEEKLILAALEHRGVAVDVIDTRRMTFVLGQFDLPYGGALVREISHTRASYATRLLEHAGLTVVNSHHVITTCGDKVLTTLALCRAGLPVPRTMVSLSADNALESLAGFGFPVVIKPVTGSWGRLAAMAADWPTAQTVLEHRAALPGPQHQMVYAQEYVDKPGRDIRAIVIGGEVVGVTYRFAASSREWRTNAARGARSQACRPSEELTRLLTATAAAIGDGALGIDVLEDREGRLVVNEVNHTPEFRSAAEVLTADLAGAYADYVLRRLPTVRGTR